MRKPIPELFHGIEWGSERVMAQTRDRLSGLGLRWQEVARLWDVDRPADLVRWQELQRQEAASAN